MKLLSRSDDANQINDRLHVPNALKKTLFAAACAAARRTDIFTGLQATDIAEVAS